MSHALHDHHPALEDDFNDVITKAARGNALHLEHIAQQLSKPQTMVEGWFSGREIPQADVITALASLLQLRPAALQASAERAWHPATPLPANVQSYIQYSRPESNGYLIRADNGQEIALIDPAGESKHLIELVESAALPLRYLFITHRHDDHADAAAELLKRFPHVEIMMHMTEALTRSELPELTRVIKDRDCIPFGDDQVEVVITPGHTDGSTCFRFGSSICVGDTLFAGSVGRNFGPTATYSEQLKNIRTRIFTLPKQTVILPGHGPATTVGLERLHNPFFSEPI